MSKRIVLVIIIRHMQDYEAATALVHRLADALG